MLELGLAAVTFSATAVAPFGAFGTVRVWWPFAPIAWNAMTRTGVTGV